MARLAKEVGVTQFKESEQCVFYTYSCQLGKILATKNKIGSLETVLQWLNHYSTKKEVCEARKNFLAVK
jgi:hypothetical protein